MHAYPRDRGSVKYPVVLTVDGLSDDDLGLAVTLHVHAYVASNPIRCSLPLSATLQAATRVYVG